ncbi:hypothetical protein Ddc_10038 [Ditylenchus destructor]|nr:hypothetical protein Ddc_10038 [Ditylenchus destructor]
MDLLNTQEGASRPSLISSLWSLQVQLQNEPNPIGEEMTGGSQQSLPDIMMNDCSNTVPAPQEFMDYNHVTHHCNHTSGFRSVKSLSDLNSLQSTACTGPSTSGIQVSPLFTKPGDRPGIEDDDIDDNSALLSGRPKSFSIQQDQHYLMMGLSRQQKNIDVCQWLQKLEIGSGNSSINPEQQQRGINNNMGGFCK